MTQPRQEPTIRGDAARLACALLAVTALLHLTVGAVVSASLIEDGVPWRMAQLLAVLLMLALAFWIIRMGESSLRARIAAGSRTVDQR